jgi:hypothetical protein
VVHLHGQFAKPLDGRAKGRKPPRSMAGLSPAPSPHHRRRSR